MIHIVAYYDPRYRKTIVKRFLSEKRAKKYLEKLRHLNLGGFVAHFW